jgi:hypothetical protein
MPFVHIDAYLMGCALQILILTNKREPNISAAIFDVQAKDI